MVEHEEIHQYGHYAALLPCVAYLFYYCAPTVAIWKLTWGNYSNQPLGWKTGKRASNFFSCK